MNRRDHRGHRRSAVFALRCWLLGWLLFPPGCVTSPVPEPPNLTPPDWTLMEIDMQVADLSTGRQPYTVVGRADGAHPGATVWAINLSDNGLPAWTTVAAADGSFSVTVQSMPGDELRLSQRQDGRRSMPVDLTLTDDYRLTLVERPPCLVVGPASSTDTVLEVDLGSVSLGSVTDWTLVVQNNCQTEQTVTALRWRTADRGFSTDRALPLPVAPGDTASFTVTLTASRPGEAEDILFIEITEATPQRYPLTFVAHVE